MTFAVVNGTRTYYELHGPIGAPILVLCHSLGTSVDLWDGQVAALTGDLRGIRILRYDIRGHGESAVSADVTSLQVLVADVVALLDHLEIERADFAGVSLGGLIGQSFAARFPARIRRLVLANTAAKLGTAEMWDARIATLRASGTAGVVDVAVKRWFTTQFIARQSVVVASFRRTLAGTSPVGYIACCAALRDADCRDTAPGIAAPTLVIAGEYDAVTPPDDAAWLVAHIPNARLVTLPAAHLANVEAAERFNASLAEFLSATEA